MIESNFNADEEAVIANLMAEDARANGGQPVVIDETVAPVPPPANAPIAPPVTSPAPPPAFEAATPVAPVASPADSAPAPQQPQGDVRAALRASRHDARAERERRVAAETELERLRSSAPPPPTDDGGLTADELRELQSDLPVVAKLASELERLRKQVASTPPAAPVAAPAVKSGFVPPIQDDPDVQGAIDENPDVLAWQHNPDQTAWKYVVSQENMLQSHPVWATKTLPERLAEAARRVKSELSPSSAHPPTPDEIAAAAAAAATARAPNTLSDITGGGSPKTPAPGLEQFMKMKTDEEILDAVEMLDARGGG